MLPRRRIGSEFSRIFREIESEIEGIEQEIDDLMQRARKAGPREEGEPLIYGWSLRVSSEGEPQFERFGNVGTGEHDLQELSEGWRRPHTTWHVDEDKQQVVFTADLPGIAKDEIDVELIRPSAVKIEAESEDRKYRATFEVPHELDPEATEATFNKGVLELTVGISTAEQNKREKINIG